jgi:hypothetical protein
MLKRRIIRKIKRRFKWRMKGRPRIKGNRKKISWISLKTAKFF